MQASTLSYLQAANTLASHLRSNGIRCIQERQVLLVGGSDFDFLPADILKVFIGDENRDVEGGIEVSASDIRSVHGLEKIHKAIEFRVGASVNLQHRPQGESERANISDDFDLILMRHRTFRRTPNPDPKEFKRFQPVARKVARSIYYKFKPVFRAFGYDEEDVAQVSLIHLTNFLHAYKSGASESHDKNLCIRFLRQRLQEAAKKIDRHARESCTAAYGQALSLTQMQDEYGESFDIRRSTADAIQ